MFPSEQESAAEFNLRLLEQKVSELTDDLEALSIQVNALEKAHNRLAHYVGHVTEANTIDRDMGAKV